MTTCTCSCESNQTLTLKWANTVAFIAMVTVNILANVLPIGGYTSKMVSDLYPTFFTPAPYTFIIWSAIYIAMAAFVFFQWDFGKTGAISSLRAEIGWWFVISCAFNTAWIFFWHFRLIALSTVCIIGLLISLVMIVTRIQNLLSPSKSALLSKLGFDIYFGWILVASIANISVLLVSIGWDGGGLSESFWTIALLCLTVLIGISAIYTDKRWLSVLTILWSLFGILVRHLMPVPEGFAGTHFGIILTAVIGIALLSAAVAICLATKCFDKQPDSTKETVEKQADSDA